MDPREILEGQLRECYGRVVYSHKTHEKAADILLSRQGRLKLAQIVLSAATTAGFVAAIFGAGSAAVILGALISMLLLALNSYLKDYDLGQMAQKHRQAGAALWLIRERYLSLLIDLRLTGASLENLSERRDTLLSDLHAVYAGAPSTFPKAYAKAQEALKDLEDMTFADEEIDAFLPQELKRGKPGHGQSP